MYSDYRAHVCDERSISSFPSYSLSDRLQSRNDAEPAVISLLHVDHRTWLAIPIISDQRASSVMA